MHRFDDRTGRGADGCPEDGGLYGQDSISGQGGAHVLQVHPLRQPGGGASGAS